MDVDHNFNQNHLSHPDFGDPNDGITWDALLALAGTGGGSASSLNAPPSCATSYPANSEAYLQRDCYTNNICPQVLYYYHSDHLGSSTYITTSGGNEYQFLQYLPYGGIFVEQKDAGLSVPYLFNAYEADDESGFYYAVNRYYNPEFGVFTSVDQMSDAAPNMTPYRFGFNNPLRYTDPTGNFETEGLDDWVLTSSGAAVYDVNVKDASSAHDRYGSEAIYLGESASYINGDGQQISLNKGGYASSSVLLDVATVTAKRPKSFSQNASTTVTGAGVGISSTDAVIDASISMAGMTDDLANTTKAIGNVTRTGGAIFGGIGASIDIYGLNKKPSVGSGFKLGFSLGTMAYAAGTRANPYIAVGLGIFDLFAKEKTATKIDRVIDNASYHQYLNNNRMQLKVRR